MNSISLGDMAQTLLLQRRGADLKAQMSTLTQELSSGRVSDVKSVLAGNVSYLSNLENDLKTLDGFEIVTREATQFADATQIALGRISTVAEDYTGQILTSATQAVGPVLAQISQDAVVQLETVLNALNTTSGGRSLFAGQATDTAAVADISTFMTAFEAAIAGAATPEELRTRADDWFAQPTGFLANVYTGAAEELAPFRLGDNEVVAPQTVAHDPGITGVLKELAIAAAASSLTLGFSSDTQRAVLLDASSGLLEAQNGLTALRATVGSSQERLDEIATRQGAERAALEMAKTTLLGVDPFETATKLEDVQFRLESLYTVTARMSGLSLVNYIR